MTQSINKPFKANEAAKQVEQLRKSFDAPAVAKVQGLVPAPKTSAKTRGKAGRIVGISAAENELLKNLLSTVADDPNYATISAIEAFTKLQDRYNK